jgi:hypothetical protein
MVAHWVLFPHELQAQSKLRQLTDPARKASAEGCTDNTEPISARQLRIVVPVPVAVDATGCRRSKRRRSNKCADFSVPEAKNDLTDVGERKSLATSVLGE